MNKKLFISCLSILAFSFIFSSCDKDSKNENEVSVLIEPEVADSSTLLLTYGYPPEVSDYSEYWDCSGGTYGDSVADIIEECLHSDGSWELVEIPSEYQEGTVRFECKCGYSALQIIPSIADADGLYKVTEWIEPTCEEVGWITYECEVNERVPYISTMADVDWCGTDDAMLHDDAYLHVNFKVKFTVKLEALGHNYIEVDKEGNPLEETVCPTIPIEPLPGIDVVDGPAVEKDEEPDVEYETVLEDEEPLISESAVKATDEGVYYDAYDAFINSIYIPEDKYYSCSNCGDSYVVSICDSLGHRYTSTYCFDETTHYHKALCGHENIDIENHNLVYIMDEETLQYYKYCTTCEYKDIHEHDFITTQIVDPTCTSLGYSIKTCNMCNYQMTDDEVAMTEHIYSDWVIEIEPTCYEEGKKVKSCIDCNHLVSENIDHLIHKYEEENVKSTCTEQGYTRHYCIYCNDTYLTDYTESMDHIYSKWLIAKVPTVNEEGILHKVCSNDSTHIIEYIIPKLNDLDYKVEIVSDLNVAIYKYEYDNQIFTFLVYIEEKED